MPFLKAEEIEAGQAKEAFEHSNELKKILTTVKIKSGVDFF